VKLKNKRPSYMLCPDCIEEKPIQRVMVGPIKGELEGTVGSDVALRAGTASASKYI
jgi:hypothetical protein